MRLITLHYFGSNLCSKDCQLNRRRSQVQVDDLVTKFHTLHSGHGSPAQTQRKFADVHTENYVKPKMQGRLFGVVHYAGHVQYDVTEFVAKNQHRVLQGGCVDE